MMKNLLRGKYIFVGFFAGILLAKVVKMAAIALADAYGQISCILILWFMFCVALFLSSTKTPASR